MNTNPEKTSLGRKPVFTRLSGFQMLENRKLFGTDRLTTAQFIDQMVLAGELKDPCSIATMQRLLCGAMFPDLHKFIKTAEGWIETGEPYKYSEVPRGQPGQPPKAERIREDGQLKPRMTKQQQRVHEEIRNDCERHSINAAEIIVQRFLENANRQLNELRARIESLEQAKAST